MSEAKKYAIDIKESSKAILNAVDSLSDKYAGSSDSFQKKVAESSNEDAVGVRYVGDGSENKGADGFDIEVRQLAAPQVNTAVVLIWYNSRYFIFFIIVAADLQPFFPQAS